MRQHRHSRTDDVCNKSCDDQHLDGLPRIDQQRDKQDKNNDPNYITKRLAPDIDISIFHNNFFTADKVGSMMGASTTACIAARISLSPLPVFSTRIGSSLRTPPEPAALTSPAYAVAPAGSGKTPILPSSAIDLMISSSDTVIYVPPVSFAARTARTPSRGKSTEILSAIVFAETGVIISVFARKELAMAAEPSACTPII